MLKLPSDAIAEGMGPSNQPAYLGLCCGAEHHFLQFSPVAAALQYSL